MGVNMCTHQNLIIIPTEENSWGIADTYNIKCCDCEKIIISNISLDDAEKHLASSIKKF